MSINEKPRYKFTRALEPMLKRHRFETPLSSDSLESWQYGERAHREGETIETTSWPHPSMSPLNDPAKSIYNYFMTEPRVKMDHSPWRDGKVCLPSLAIHGEQVRRPNAA